MNVRSLLSVAAILSSMALPSLAFAQDAHMISGKAVPADQVAEVQAKCDELRAAPPAADAMAAAPAADKTAGWMADGAKIDTTKLTVALCDEGKFVATKK